MSPKFVFLGISCLGFALGLLSAVRPERSIALYQWIMERINWKVIPIDMSREVRNTRIEGLVLIALSLAAFFIAVSRF
jgi:hypothetical protein